jgi:hypothetical protein
MFRIKSELCRSDLGNYPSYFQQCCGESGFLLNVMEGMRWSYSSKKKFYLSSRLHNIHISGVFTIILAQNSLNYTVILSLLWQRKMDLAIALCVDQNSFEFIGFSCQFYRLIEQNTHELSLFYYDFLIYAYVRQRSPISPIS